MKNEIILFDNNEVRLEVSLDQETVWLTQEQIAKLFGRDKSVIAKHIKFAWQQELDKDSTMAKYATVQKEGNREIERMLEYYNLDMIISVRI
jgi:hypothetical protein